MKFTLSNKKPTKTGWYWMKMVNLTSPLMIVECYSDDNDQFCFEFNGHYLLVEMENALWSQRIPEPVVKKGKK